MQKVVVIIILYPNLNWEHTKHTTQEVVQSKAAGNHEIRYVGHP
jgi:hypothetical protein